MANTFTWILVVATVVVYAHPQFDDFSLGLDANCLKKTPEVYRPCRMRTIWTFDWCALRCVQRTGCFPPGNLVNAFPSQQGCYMYCSRRYE
ncbi:hypothetical protein DPMN_157524 [Dreissena polymorpha]|uniref:Uncharacterized protein n=1 Tax=Dreissena polymorpha TaxID=45954 RepID=A0A9D4EKN1_DREPO|nr:hypothetical protein DPMN_157524 [Dreissena polymorpha]